MNRPVSNARSFCNEAALSLGQESAVTRMITYVLKHFFNHLKIWQPGNHVLLRCALLLVCLLAAFTPQARGDQNRANGTSETLNCACLRNLFGVISVGNIRQNSVDSVLSDEKSVPRLHQHPIRHYKKSLRFLGRRCLKPQSLAASQPVSRSTFFKTLVTTHLSIACQGGCGDRRPDTFPLII